MNETERYSIYCKQCEDDKVLIRDTDSGSYQCPDCDSIYYDEDGVWDEAEVAYFYQTYLGAVRAGMIEDPDFPDEHKGMW